MHMCVFVHVYQTHAQFFLKTKLVVEKRCGLAENGALFLPRAGASSNIHVLFMRGTVPLLTSRQVCIDNGKNIKHPLSPISQFPSNTFQLMHSHTHLARDVATLEPAVLALDSRKDKHALAPRLHQIAVVREELQHVYIHSYHTRLHYTGSVDLYALFHSGC